MQRSFTFVFLLVVLLRCVVPLAAQEAVEWPTTEWPTSTPEEQGMDSAELAGLFANFSQPFFNMDGLMVVRHGVNVAEVYAPPQTAEIPHHMASGAKSVVATLIGALLQEGKLESLDTPVLSLFPDRTVQNPSPEKEAITVRHLLTMSSGLACDANAPGDTTNVGIENSEDWLQYVLDLPVTAEPGTEWRYCNAAISVLSALITELTGISALDYAKEVLFEPLSINDVAWGANPQGTNMGAADLFMTVPDMAKLGYLYLHGGEWDGQQIIPADFAAEATHTQINTPWDGFCYGYLWWTDCANTYAYALGAGGTYIVVNPSQDTVIVHTGGAPEAIRVAIQGFPFLYMANALTLSDEPLSANPGAFAQLEEVIAAVENPEPQPIPDAPAMAGQVSGQNFFVMNPFQLEKPGGWATNSSGPVGSLAFDFNDPAQAAVTFGMADGKVWTAPVGLDGLPMVSESPVGPMAVHGQWVSNDTFRMYLENVGDGQITQMDVQFFPGWLRIVGSEYKDSNAWAALGFAPPQ